MKKRVERKLIYHVIYVFLIILVLFSNFFNENLTLIFKLKPNIRKSEATQVHFIDVGQGDAIAVNLSNGQIMLIDSGISDYREKLTTYLDKVVLNNDKTIDYLILTHPDIDHSGNMEYILRNYNVKSFYRPEIYEVSENTEPSCENSTYKETLIAVKDLNIPTYFNNEREIIDGNISIKWLNVLDRYEDINDIGTNQFSPIIIIEDNDKSIMLTGDIDTYGESLFIDKYGELLDIDILKLAHHGSKNSNCMEFIDITSPDYFVTSVGENTYGHPANDTILRMLEYDKLNNKNTYNSFKSTLTDGNIVYTLETNIYIDIIANIDDYNFVDYYIYSIILSIFILFLYLKPYIFVWKKNIRFYFQNKAFEKQLNKERELRFVEKRNNSTIYD